MNTSVSVEYKIQEHRNKTKVPPVDREATPNWLIEYWPALHRLLVEDGIRSSLEDAGDDAELEWGEDGYYTETVSGPCGRSGLMGIYDAIHALTPDKFCDHMGYSVVNGEPVLVSEPYQYRASDNRLQKLADEASVALSLRVTWSRTAWHNTPDTGCVRFILWSPY